MSKTDTIIRYSLIIRKLRKQPSTFKEIEAYLALESEIQGVDFNISKRTFHRDINDIRLIYNIDIQHDFSRKVYHIVPDEQEDLNQRMLEAFDLFNALRIEERLSDYIHFEQRKSKGTEYLWIVLDSIKSGRILTFEYKSFWYDSPKFKVVKPYALKEFNNRWYLIAFENRGRNIKTYALDRLKDPIITHRSFEYPKDFDVKEYFKYSYGIISSNELEPQRIILSFDGHQGKYIKSLPLHDSQIVLKDTPEEVIISLYLCVTFDFVRELLSFGKRMQVISPKSLVEEISSNLNIAAGNYTKNKPKDIVVSLNELLYAKDMNEEQIRNTFSNLVKGMNCSFCYIDLQKHSPEKTEKAKVLKVKAIKMQNFERATKLRKIEKESFEHTKKAKGFRVKNSVFISIDHQLMYFYYGSEKNDRILNQCFRELIRDDEGTAHNLL